MTDSIPMTMTESYKVGLAHGYAHANYAENVNGDLITDEFAETESEKASLPGYVDAGTESAYRTGYRDGINDYYEMIEGDER